MSVVPKESCEQAAFVRWLSMKEYLFCHVPNEARRSVVTAAILKSQGMKAGVPDNLIFSPVPHVPWARGVAIEMKRIKGGVISDLQAGWLRELQNAGWITHVARGADDAISFMEELGFG